MFMHSYMFEAFQKWTALSLKGLQIEIELSIQQFQGYVGLEMALFLTRVSIVIKIRSSNMFSCLNEFQAEISPENFKAIGSSSCHYHTYDMTIILPFTIRFCTTVRF